MEYEEKNKKKIFGNILVVIGIVVYLGVISIIYQRTNPQTLKYLSLGILGICIILFEIAYKKDNLSIGVTGSEILILAVYTLSIEHVVEFSNLEFSTYILISLGIFVAYYFIKTLLIYTNNRRKYLKSLSDIKEILEYKPVKKVAVKRNK